MDIIPSPLLSIEMKTMWSVDFEHYSWEEVYDLLGCDLSITDTNPHPE